MADSKTLEHIDQWVENNWEDVVKDIEKLVNIPSQEDLDHAGEGMPYGPGPLKALEAGLEMCERMGMKAANHEGYVGTADYTGENDDKKICIIGHLDTVPCGPGWSQDPHKMTRRDGYLIGRGTLDDKGPFVVSAYAAKYWHEQGYQFPYTLRFILGCNEETGFLDVYYYKEHFEEPAFIMSPDAEYPVSAGEKGIYQGVFTSGPISDGKIVSWNAGEAPNAIPSDAFVIVNADISKLPTCPGITLTDEGDGNIRIDAKGKGGHAAKPEGTKNAIGMLVDYMLDNDLVSESERQFLNLQKTLIDDYSGEGVGVKAEDDLFGPLTIIGGTAWKDDDGTLHQSCDSRYPTTFSCEQFEKALSETAAKFGATYETDSDTVPFWIDPNGQEVQRLTKVYNDLTGENRKAYTLGGGTYCREFKNGAAFGVEMPWRKDPDWVGGMHGDNEGISEYALQLSLKCYILAIKEIMEIDY